MKNWPSRFRYTQQQRRGVLALLFLIVLLQGVYYYLKAHPFAGDPMVTVAASVQARVDSLAQATPTDAITLFPFNPNYITDYKGYRLGMSPQELDRLFAYRNQHKFVHSAAEFQQLTQISDSLLAAIAPYFSFPAWTQNRKPPQRTQGQAPPTPPPLKDLNTATAEELMRINGIGPVLSQRLVKFRTRLGGFLVDEQLYDVYGLAPEVVERTLERFRVQQPPPITKMNLNTATAWQLSRMVYINYALAQQIVAYRVAKGPYTSLDELREVKGFPTERIARIKLYLTL